MQLTKIKKIINRINNKIDSYRAKQFSDKELVERWEDINEDGYQDKIANRSELHKNSKELISFVKGNDIDLRGKNYMRLGVDQVGILDIYSMNLMIYISAGTI